LVTPQSVTEKAELIAGILLTPAHHPDYTSTAAAAGTAAAPGSNANTSGGGDAGAPVAALQEDGFMEMLKLVRSAQPESKSASAGGVAAVDQQPLPATQAMDVDMATDGVKASNGKENAVLSAGGGEGGGGEGKGGTGVHVDVRDALTATMPPPVPTASGSVVDSLQGLVASTDAQQRLTAHGEELRKGRSLPAKV
jgi:hypothetical protein